MNLFLNSIQQLAQQICDQSAEYQLSGSVKIDNPKAVEWRKSLESLIMELQQALDTDRYEIKLSIGSTNYPYVKWICILAPGHKIGHGDYVAICFDYRGKGFIAGLAKSVSNPPPIALNAQRRTPLLPGSIDVNSPSKHKTQAFNDSFYNPREFFRDSFSAAEFIQHLQDSLGKYKRLLAGEDIEMNTEAPARVYITRLNLDTAGNVKMLKTFTQDKLNVKEETIQAGDPVFIYFGGETSKSWTPGLAAIGIIVKAPYDIVGSNFKIDIEPQHILSQPIPHRKSSIHPEIASSIYDVPYVGAKHFATQALQTVGGIKTGGLEGLKAICTLYLEADPSSKSVLQKLGLLLDPPAQPKLVSASKGTYSANPPAAAVTLTAQEERIKALMLTYKQVILYGPPGTGKTYHARRIAQTLDTHDLAVFHPSYGYEDFVGSIRPRLVSSDPGSPAPPALQVEEFIGIFQRLCRRAQAQPAQKHLLILDEINRGDIARIFGELIYAIEADKRGSTVALPYLQDGTLTVPANLYLIGTMNSSDRSITQLDVALRRRFAFFEVEPASGLLAKATIGPVSLQALLDRLNDLLLQYRDRDHRIGQAYLMTPDPGNSQPLSTAAELSNAWYYRILPLLAEYFYSDPTRLAAFLGPAFIRTRPGTAGDYDSQPVYETRSYVDDTAFLAALQQFVTGGPPAPAGTPVPAPLPLTEDESEIDEDLGIDSEAAI